MTRNFAANVNLKYNNTLALLDFTKMFIQRVYVERRWGHLNDCQPYNVDLDVTKIVDDPNALYINRFNKNPGRSDEPEWDYFGMRGKPLLELLPEWTEKVELFNNLGLTQLVDSPCVLVTNRRVVIHRDGRPDIVPGYSNRECGINYLMMNTSVYDTGVWADTEKTLANDFEGLELTKPSALIKYDSNSMNIVHTALPHGSYIDPSITPPPELAPRAFITMGFTCSYAEARQKIANLVNFDW